MQLVELDNEPAEVAFLITGVPGSGKTTVSRELARRFPRAAHISSDAIGAMILSGKVLPHPPYTEPMPLGAEDGGEADRQLLLRAHSAGLLCDSFFRAGFTPIVDDVVVRKLQLDYYLAHIQARPLLLVVLSPKRDVVFGHDSLRDSTKRGLAEEWWFLTETLQSELLEVGIWIDTSDQSPCETVDTILETSNAATGDV
jgi:hypothetical protein